MSLLILSLDDVNQRKKCVSGLEGLIKLIKANRGSLSLDTIIKNNGISDAVWCAQALPAAEQWRLALFACSCAERILHIANDERCDWALRISRRYAFGIETEDSLRAAQGAIWSLTVEAVDSTREAVICVAQATHACASGAEWYATMAIMRSVKSKKEYYYEPSLSIAEHKRLFRHYMDASLTKEKALEELENKEKL